MAASSTLRIFVSHSHHDNDWCTQLVDALTLDGFDVWFDKQGLYVGDQWISKLETEIEGRDVFLVVLTPASWSSPWVRREYELALHRNKRILGVMHKSVGLTGFITTLQILGAVGLDAATAAERVTKQIMGQPVTTRPPASASRALGYPDFHSADSIPPRTWRRVIWPVLAYGLLVLAIVLGIVSFLLTTRR